MYFGSSEVVEVLLGKRDAREGGNGSIGDSFVPLPGGREGDIARHPVFAIRLPGIVIDGLDNERLDVGEVVAFQLEFGFVIGEIPNDLVDRQGRWLGRNGG